MQWFDIEMKSDRQELVSSLRPPPDAGRAAVAMSGGVDSSVAAALLLEAGWDLIGIHLKLADHKPGSSNTPRRCCSLDDALDAREVCHRLGISFYVLDFTESFRQAVIDPFAAAYHNGRTPNPCVHCNTRIKGQKLLAQVRAIGCTHLASGHYARLQPIETPPAEGHEVPPTEAQSTDRQPPDWQPPDWQLCRPRDRSKDQTYFLFETPRAHLPFLLYPLANCEKPLVRELAARHGLNTWGKADSQEICFVPKDYRRFLEEHPHPRGLPGDIVDAQGRCCGTHRGLAYYTIGQRRGLELVRSRGAQKHEPLYVIGLDAAANRVIVGPERALYGTRMRLRQVNWVSIPPPKTNTLRLDVKIRLGQAPAAATLHRKDAAHAWEVALDAPLRAITPGQAAAFYQGEVLLGGGWIESSLGQAA